MKSLKIFSLALLLVLAAVGCMPDNNGHTGGKKGELTGEWKLAMWNEATPEFNVYIDFNEDGTFEMYQQVWSLDYELFTGNYVINGDIVTGTYIDGTNWACGYKFAKEGNTLTMYSQEDQSVASVYEACEIPAEIKAEATDTRAMEVVPFL